MTAGAGNVMCFEGSPWDVGYAQGLAVKDTLRGNQEEYIGGMARAGLLDTGQMRREAMPWFETVAPRYREELEGIARGAGIPLTKMIEWLYGSCYAVSGGCTSVIASIAGRTWIAHNNDWHDFGSHRWTSAIVRHVEGRIPNLVFGLQGDVAAVVGVNRERLWLNMNGFFANDEHRPHTPVIPYPLVIREALETCRSIGDVEDLLRECDRDAGLAIYAVDGKTGEAAVIECGFGTYTRRDPVESKTVVSCSRDLSIREVPDEEAVLPDVPIFGSNTRERIARLRELLAAPMTDPPADLIRVVADPEVEASDTLYSNVACPETGEVWFGSGGLPAASAGTWQRIEWPWEDDH